MFRVLFYHNMYTYSYIMYVNCNLNNVTENYFIIIIHLFALKTMIILRYSVIKCNVCVLQLLRFSAETNGGDDDRKTNVLGPLKCRWWAGGVRKKGVYNPGGGEKYSNGSETRAPEQPAWDLYTSRHISGLITSRVHIIKFIILYLYATLYLYGQ